MYNAEKDINILLDHIKTAEISGVNKILSLLFSVANVYLENQMNKENFMNDASKIWDRMEALVKMRKEKQDELEKSEKDTTKT